MEDSTARRLWEAALGQLELQVSRPNYQTWLKDTVGLHYNDGTFVVGAPTDFACQWLSYKLRPLIRKTLASILGHAVEVSFQVIPVKESQEPLPLQTEAPAPACRQEPPPGRPPRLNPRYTFQRFIVGSGNRLAYAASLAVAERPAATYNPLFLYGGVGLGKTHLLHAIGHRALEGKATVVYTTSEQFTNEFVTAIMERRLGEFRQRYRSPDVLLIDDIQFIAGKEQTQEEFFHTFDALHEASKQIVITSDRSPKLISLLEDRLRSRFEWGLIADIQPPDLETRLAILRTRANEMGVELPQAVLELIAQRIQDNIRQLEGCLNRVVAYARLEQGPITVDTATKALAGVLDVAAQPPPTPERILSAVAQYFGLSTDDLTGTSRRKDVAYARHLAAYLLKDLAQRRVTEVARLLGKRDHSTILHSYHKTQIALETEPQTRRHLANIRHILNNGHDQPYTPTRL